MSTGNADPCPCGSARESKQCCLAYIDGVQVPPTAEALMRSRYTAYTLDHFDYLRSTWASDSCPTQLDAVRDQRWIGLTIKRTDAGGANDATGTVEFVARYKIGGRAYRIHETSRFERVDGRWIYIDGNEHNPRKRG